MLKLANQIVSPPRGHSQIVNVKNEEKAMAVVLSNYPTSHPSNYYKNKNTQGGQ